MVGVDQIGIPLGKSHLELILKKLHKVAVGTEQLVPVSANHPSLSLLLLVLRIVPRRS